MQVCEERVLALRRLILLAEICLKWPIINQPFAVVPALNSVLFYFTLKVTSGYSISFLKIEQEEPVSHIYALRGPLHSNNFF